MTTVTEQEAEIDEKCMFAVHAKQLSQYLRPMYGHLVNANTLDFRPYGRKSRIEFRYFPSVRTDGATLLPKVVAQTK